jgi:long-chain acyl-CoA synthetase
LIQKADCTVIALVRAEDHEGALHRLARAWWDWRELADAIGTRVQVECGDVSAPCLGLEGATYDALVHTVTHIVHNAADLRVNAPIQGCATFVQGIAMLDFARAVQRDHGLARASNASTAYVRARGVAMSRTRSAKSSASLSLQPASTKARRFRLRKASYPSRSCALG